MFDINYFALVVSSVLAMALGAWWYGPLFGKRWMEIIGASGMSAEEKEKMQKEAMPLYAVQFTLTLLQAFVLALLLKGADSLTGFFVTLLTWGTFVIPTLAGGVMWTNEAKAVKWSRFLIQGGYQLVIFAMFGLLLNVWR